MIPVDQTIFGAPNGNCFAACVASVLELALDSVPHFCKGDAPDWYQRFQAWAFELGFVAIESESWLEPLRDAHVIVTGKAARGHLHSCVYKGAKLEHDPHPSRDGLLGFTDVVMLLPRDPARALHGPSPA